MSCSEMYLCFSFRQFSAKLSIMCSIEKEQTDSVDLIDSVIALIIQPRVLYEN